MGLYHQLQARAEAGAPIRVGVIGAGKFGTMFLAQTARLPGVQVLGVADLRVAVARENLALAGWAEGSFDAASLDAAFQSGGTHVGDNAAALIAHPAVDIIVDCTGHPVVAVDHALAAFDAGKHVISATVEADAFLGPTLPNLAAKAGVIYSLAYGDQPAMTVELVDWARTCGFEVVGAGRGHKWKPEYRYSTPETIWDHWGVPEEVAKRGRLNPKMFNSFLDGTKPAIESSAIANACGLDAPEGGLAYPAGSIDDIPSIMRTKAEGGALDKLGQVEVINCLDTHGDPIAYDIRMGVFVSVKAVTEYQKRCFEEYKVTTDDSGLYLCAYKRWHLIGLELGISVANVGLRGEATGQGREFRADVPAVAKRDLSPGEILDGEGGYCVAGTLRPARLSAPMGAFPLGLTEGAKMVRPVARDQILTYEDVEFDETTAAARLRRELEATV